MSHIHEHKDDLIKRVRRIAGQVEAVERALESDADCAKTLHLVAAIRGGSMVCWSSSSTPTPASTWPIRT